MRRINLTKYILSKTLLLTLPKITFPSTPPDTRNIVRIPKKVLNQKLAIHLLNKKIYIEELGPADKSPARIKAL